MKTVAIVGGGIGGLASAILLSEKGYSVTVYDKAKSPLPVGAGFLLQPPGQEILNRLGVLEKVREEAVPIGGLQSRTLAGRTLLNLKYNQLAGSPRHGLGVQRSTIYDALLQKATDSNLVNIVWDSDIESCTVSDNQVSVAINGTRYAFDLCILSSGSNSQLTTPHFKNRVKRPYGWGCLWTTIELPESLSPDTLHQRCESSEKMMGILPVRKTENGYQAALYWSMKSRDLDGLEEGSFNTIKEEIIQFWPDTAGSLLPLNFNDFVAANYNDIWTPHPFNGRLIAIGDVSHATSPQLGQGCTMALLDAWSLAQHIDHDDEKLADSLELWWRSRRYQLAYVRHLSRLLTPLFQSESVICEVFRDWVMAPIGRLPLFNQLQLKTLASEVFLTKL